MPYNDGKTEPTVGDEVLGFPLNDPESPVSGVVLDVFGEGKTQTIRVAHARLMAAWGEGAERRAEATLVQQIGLAERFETVAHYRKRIHGA